MWSQEIYNWQNFHSVELKGIESCIQEGRIWAYTCLQGSWGKFHVLFHSPSWALHPKRTASLFHPLPILSLVLDGVTMRSAGSWICRGSGRLCFGELVSAQILNWCDLQRGVPVTTVGEYEEDFCGSHQEMKPFITLGSRLLFLPGFLEAGAVWC